MPAAVCAAPRHQGQDEPTPAEPAATLCRPCRLGLAWDLRHLPRIDAELAILTTISHNAPGNGTIPLPFDAAITEWRSWFRRNITRATADIAAERHKPLPEDHPYAMCDWLALQVTWVSFRDWAWRLTDITGRIRARGEHLRAPITMKRIILPGACLACGNSHLLAVIYADHKAGRWSYWMCPACQAVTEMESWWEYPRRLVQAAG